MARIRTIKPEFPHSESMGNISRDARLTFIMLWTLADDSGRLRGNSRMLASLLFPYDDDAPALIGNWLTELEREGCIELYTIDGTAYCQICKWLSHQKIDKPSSSKIPPPTDASRGVANVRESSPLDQGSRIKEEDQGIGSGIMDRESDHCSNIDLRDQAIVDSVPENAVDPKSAFKDCVSVFLDKWQTLPAGVRGVVHVAAIGATGYGIWAHVSPKDKEAIRSVLPHRFEAAMKACDAIENGAIEWDRAAMTLRQFPDAIDSLVADACKKFYSQPKPDLKTSQATAMLSDLEKYLTGNSVDITRPQRLISNE